MFPGRLAPHYMHFAAIIGIEAGTVDGCREGGRCWREELYLFGNHLQVALRKRTQPLHIFISTAGVGGNQVIGQKLFFAESCSVRIKELLELQQGGSIGLAHQFENVGFTVFRRQFELSRNVMCSQCSYVLFVIFAVCHYHVVPQAGGDKDVFDTRQIPQTL